ncbi:MAG: hypothetical protein CL944_02850 [Candidatus Diapherotrites archaeon]|uniref:DUF3179 domain-containing protein n=1 Tax=Candidatus Iainarchaeum sp. TaxID=3101447 RepID=A0A2D6LQD1_9ARCH|nr:hypothetical protein [Candidatus Diapherotrites archaeon]|tara:strand:+ start:3261 stop:4340 length:1080 start_codon:yes stop_codon:yes gene_type:complete
MKELTILLAGMIFLFGCTSGVTNDPANDSQTGITQPQTPETPETNGSGSEEESNVPSNIFQYDDLSDNEIRETNGIKHLVPLENIHAGCFGMDCIPSIDNPKFESAAKGNEWLQDDDIILGVEYKGVKRAYPLGILNWHEIVNDTIAGDPIVITYCPLCATGLAFERTLNGEAVEFGVSGKLYNSDLVMYDRKTETYWEQISGTAIVGTLTGQRLNRIPIETALWGDWLEKYPDTEVLSRETGEIRDYANYPYGDYQESRSVFFPIDNEDDRLHEKTIVHGIELNNQYKAYVDDAIEKGEIVKEEFSGSTIEVEKDSITDGVRAFILDANGERQTELVTVRSFWFAWFSFHPQTELYEG